MGMSIRRPRGRRAAPGAGWRLRTLLLLAMLVPLVGASIIGGAVVRERREIRTASLSLERAAADLALQTRFVSALASEEIHSNVLGLVATYAERGTSVDINIDLTRARLTGARALVDSRRFADIRSTLGIDDQLRRFRHRLDSGSADYDGVSTFFRTTDAAIDATWKLAIVEVDHHADLEDLPADLRNRLRSLRGAMTAFSLADDRIEHALALFLATPTATRTRLLIDASGRFEAGIEAAQQTASPRLTETWRRWEAAPATERTEERMDLATRIGLGVEPPVSEVDPAALTQALSDGARWVILLTDVVRAAAVELEEAADAHADSSARAMAAQLAGMIALVAGSVTVAVLIARAITVPVRRLEEAARHVEAGDFELPHLPDRGPRELAATARAFNDMSGTLLAVEGHALALAGDPSSTAPEEVLPGRTGEAMQAALDRLRSSIAEGEARRSELAVLASHDALTGLLNRGAALEALERDLARAERDGSSLLALYVDLDGLKQINDTYGHAAGDDAIHRTAEALRSSTRDGDVVARLGGDEFLVAGPLPVGGRAGADAFAHRVRDAVRSQAAQVADEVEVPLRCSVGAAVSGSGTATADELVRAADTALYEAKNAGRDQVAWSTDPTGLVDQPS
jgi:diguanylate cyclase (GGDEF)-like protein